LKRRALIAAGALAALVVAFLAGRFSAPVRVEERTKVETQIQTVTEWRDRIVEREVVKWRERVVAVETVRPDGTIERTTTTDRGADVDTSIDAEGSGSATAAASERQETERVVSTERPGWGLGVAAAWEPGRLTGKPDRIGLELDRRLFGTVWLGLRADTDRRVGLGVRVEW
jgi:hypothetical protein